MSNDGSSKTGFVVSVTIHVLFFGVLLLFVWMNMWKPEPQPVIFEIVAMPEDAPIRQPAEQPPAPDLDDLLDPADIKKFEPVDLPDIRMPEPPPQVAPAPAPPPPKPQNRPEEKPQPREEPVTRMTAEEFRKKYGTPQPRTRTQPTQQRTTVQAPSINVDASLKSLSSILDSTSQRQAESMTASQRDALAAYIGRLRSSIEIAWDRPKGIPAGFETVIEFSIAPSGAISNARIVRSSGNQVLDASVLNAVRSARAVGQLPASKTMSFMLPFRID